LDLAAQRGSWPARVVEFALAWLIFAGSLILVAIPLATLWLLSRVSGDYLTIYLLALVGCPLALISWGMVLARLNRWLTGVRGAPATVLEASITASVLIALAALAVWVAFFAEGPGPRVVI
jgi:hypothetical protein